MNGIELKGWIFLTPCKYVINGQAKQIPRIFRPAMTLPAFVVEFKQEL